jgi:hypothetical protein
MDTLPNSMLDLPIVSPTDDLGNANLSLFNLKSLLAKSGGYLIDPISNRCIGFVLEVC